MKWLVTIIILTMFSSTAAAIMGPPVADLKLGQGEYCFSFSRFDCEDHEIATTWNTRLGLGHYLTIVEPEPFGKTVGDKQLDYTQSSIVKEKRRTRGFNTSISMARFGYGITDNVNLDLYLSVSELDLSGPIKHETGYGCGIGLRINLYQEGRLTVGTLARYRRFEWEDEFDEAIGPIQSPDGWNGPFVTTEATWAMDYHEWMFAIGPAYEIIDGWSVYGGPFYSIIKGTAKAEYQYYGEYISWDNRDENGYGLYETQTISVGQKGNSEFDVGGFGLMFGTELVLNERLAMRLEADLTEDNSTLGASVAYRF